MDGGEYPLDQIYQAIVGHYGIQPSEFWKMTFPELENIHNSKRSKMIGNVHEDDYARMVKRGEELEAQGIKVL